MAVVFGGSSESRNYKVDEREARSTQGVVGEPKRRQQALTQQATIVVAAQTQETAKRQQPGCSQTLRSLSSGPVVPTTRSGVQSRAADEWHRGVECSLCIRRSRRCSRGHRRRGLLDTEAGTRADCDNRGMRDEV
ncbi:hypothetical protein COCMIDRAFT_27030 [Bipolaris oryzae ATCC 44560]|uniref:Uncharacterized protein n=1 Tax=Bipolaris oryzae ATCC 44560 TaxID=930090 RepID=W6ZM89_COCMI|nr:uncharacterized protein COCMIDRAFT_27030 [Bipolaris oryzae ATCC 44560]EUC44691.1 hypothetical protein COCMIDRAFT_27030 [Bipolaris oryzae ATCC 44560]